MIQSTDLTWVLPVVHALVCVLIQFFVHVCVSCIGGFVLRVTISLPSLFVEFIHAPVYTTSSLFLPLKRILLCTSSIYYVPVSQQLTLSQLLTSYLHRQYFSAEPHSCLVDLCPSGRTWVAGVFVYLALQNVCLSPHASKHGIPTLYNYLRYNPGV